MTAAALPGLEPGAVYGDPAAGARVYTGRCPVCRAGVTVRCTLEDVRAADWQTRSGCHGRWTVLEPLRATTVAGRRCDSRCTNAVGSTCECECGGERHGQRFRVGVSL